MNAGLQDMEASTTVFTCCRRNHYCLFIDNLAAFKLLGNFFVIGRQIVKSSKCLQTESV